MTDALNPLSEDDWEFRRPRALWVAIAALAALSMAAAVSVGLLAVGLPILPWFGAAMFAAATVIFAALLTFWLVRRGSLAFTRRAELWTEMIVAPLATPYSRPPMVEAQWVPWPEQPCCAMASVTASKGHEVRTSR